MKLILILADLVSKQNCCIWGTENPHAYLEKATHPKWVNVLVRILIQRHNWNIFLRKSARRDPYTANGDRYRIMLKEFLFTKIEERRILATFGFNIRCFAPYFWRSHYQPRSWYRLVISKLQFDTVGLLLVKYSFIQSIISLKIGPIV